MKPGNLIGLCSTIFAGALILIGLSVSSNGLIAFLRSDSTSPSDELLLGATLFKVSLALLGVLMLLLARLPIWNDEREGMDAPEKPPSKRILGILIVMLVISFALRLYQLGSGLWLDEILTYVNYAQNPLGEIVTTYASENQHSLYSILARISFLLFGESAWALRLPAAILGVASIWALFLFGRLVSNDREAILAAALMAFSYHHVWFSQNARGYTGLLFWTILASWFLLRALRESRTRLWLLYATTAALGMYTHLTMMFVIFGHFIIYLATFWRRHTESWHRRWYGITFGFGSAVLLTFLLYALVLPQLLAAVDATESVVEEWRNPLWTALELIQGVMANFSGGLAVVGVLVGALALLLFAAGASSYRHTNVYVLLMLFVPVLAGSAMTIAMGHHLWPRFFFFAFGFGALVVVRGVMVIGSAASRVMKLSPDRVSYPGLVLGVAMVLIMAVSVAFAYGPKQDYDGALAYVESQKESGDAVIVVDLAAYVYEHFYDVDWYIVETGDELDSVNSRTNRSWILYTFPPVLESVNPDIMNRIQRDFQTVARFGGSVRQGTIFVSLSKG